VLLPHRPLVLTRAQVLKAETNTGGNGVRVVTIPSQLSLVTDIGRNSWCPLNPKTRINNSTIVTFTRAEKRRRDSRESHGADGYRHSRVFEFVFPSCSYGRN